MCFSPSSVVTIAARAVAFGIDRFASLLYVRVGPAFIITAHATAHLLIPFLLS